MFTKWMVLQDENPYLDARMNSCRTLTSQSLDGPVAGVSSRPWLRDTLWMYRADRQRWFDCIPKKRQSESKKMVFLDVFGPWKGCGWVTWTPLGQNSAMHDLFGRLEEILPVMHQVFKLCKSLFISLPSADLVFMLGGCKSMVRF